MLQEVTQKEILPRRFYIVGCQRSGTTLLRLMLESHPAIYCYDELLAYERLRNADFAAPVCDKRIALLGFKIPRWTEQLLAPQIIDNVDHSGAAVFYNGEPLLFMLRDVRDTVASMLALKDQSVSWIEHWGKRILLDNLAETPLFAQRYAEEVRLLEKFNWSHAAVGAVYWKYKTNAYSEYLQKGLPVLGVSYEQLTQNPASELAKILSFLGLEWNDAVLEHSKAKHTEVFEDGTTLGGTDPKRPVDTRSVLRWQSQLSREQVEQIMTIAGDT